MKKLFKSPSPPQISVMYISPGYDLGVGGHNKYTCDGHEIDEIYCDGRGARYLIVARKPDSRKRYVGFDYNLNTGQSKYFDFSLSEKEIRKIVEPMNPVAVNEW